MWLTRETGDTLPADTRDRASAALAVVWEPDQAGLLQTVYVQVRKAVGSAGTPDHDQVFRKYHRAEEAKGLAGAGLGLWLGHNLAQRLGGTLSVQTVNDHVEFKLCLPLTTPP